MLAARRASSAAGCRPRAAPRRVAGLLALAPLIVVEDLSATRIAKARAAIAAGQAVFYTSWW